MARWGDSGGYSADNVKIISAVENNSDRLDKKSGLPTGVARNKGKFIASKMVGGKDFYIGRYDTPEEAHQAYLAFIPKKRKAAKK